MFLRFLQVFFPKTPTNFRVLATDVLLYMLQSLRVLLYELPCDHDLMSAPLTFQTKIRAHTQDLPVMAAAGMTLF